MKIFEFTFSEGQTDYVCADNIIDALREHHNKTDVDVYVDDFEIEEVPEHEWRERTFKPEDEEEISFAEFMKTQTEAELFCSSEFNNE